MAPSTGNDDDTDLGNLRTFEHWLSQSRPSARLIAALTAARDVSRHRLSIVLQPRIESGAVGATQCRAETGDTAMVKSWRPLLALCASVLPFVSFAQAPTTFNEAFGVTHEASQRARADLPQSAPGSDLRSWVIHWNEVAINASGIDHTPVAPGENRVIRRTDRTGPLGTCDRDRADRGVRRAGRSERGLHELHSVCRASAGKSRRRPPWHTRRMTLSVALFPFAEGFVRQRACKTACGGCAIRQPRSSTASVSASELLTQFSIARRRWLAARRARCSVRTGRRATIAATGVQDPISLSTVALGAQLGRGPPVRDEQLRAVSRRRRRRR
jgi:hypothetical protein